MTSKMTSTFPLYAAALGIDIPGMIQCETNKAKYRAVARQTSYHEKGAAEFEANWKKANEFLAGFWKEIELLEKEGK